jgi:hypothetical protein
VIIAGYLHARRGSTDAVPVIIDQFVRTDVDGNQIIFPWRLWAEEARIDASVVLTVLYFPVPYQGGRRETFLQGVPNRCTPGECIVVNRAEARALFEARAAIPC